MFVALYILYLCGLITESKEPLCSHKKIKLVMQPLSSSNFEDVKVAIATLENTLCDKNLAEKKV